MTSSWLPRATACRDSTLHSFSGVEWPRPSKASQWAEHNVQRVIADIVQPSEPGLLRVRAWAVDCLKAADLPSLGLAVHHVLRHQFPAHLQQGHTCPKVATMAYHLLVCSGVARLRVAIQRKRLPRWSGRVFQKSTSLGTPGGLRYRPAVDS